MVMRHASARTYGDSDHARVLTRRGLAEAAEVAGLLCEAGVSPDLALVSSATRAQQTWAAVSARCGDCEVEVSDGLYSASSDAVLDAVRVVPESTGTVLYLGHNPTASHLAAVLAGEQVSTEALSHIVGGMPPATAAVFGVEPEWADIAPGVARLLHVLRPSQA